MGATVRAFVGLGANVGDARVTLTDAVAALERLSAVTVRGVSRLYRTKPVGLTDQPDFLNAAAAIDVSVERDDEERAAAAVELLTRLKGLEREFGRRKRRRWGPRELDLDLLLFGDQPIAVERPPEGVSLSAGVDPGAAARLLEVPHPAMAERLFVLAPLSDLAPDLVPPGWSESIEAARRRRAIEEGEGAVVPVASWRGLPEGWRDAGSSIVVRHAVPADAAAAARAHTASAEAAYRGIAPSEANGLERRTRRWEEILQASDEESFVAEADGEIVGVLNVGPARDASGDGEVRILYVHPAWWGRGAGQALIDRADRELARDHDEAVLTVLAANERARRFYERNGWRPERIQVEPHFGGVPVEVARYRKRLRER